jgi:hypothetical protein
MAKALGPIVPDKLLALADEVIEWRRWFAAIAHSRFWPIATWAQESLSAMPAKADKPERREWPEGDMWASADTNASAFTVTI